MFFNVHTRGTINVSGFCKDFFLFSVLLFHMHILFNSFSFFQPFINYLMFSQCLCYKKCISAFPSLQYCMKSKIFFYFLSLNISEFS